MPASLPPFSALRRRFFSTGANNFYNTKEDFSSLVSITENEDLIAQIPLEDVRNFCFIAHIDHGKSSLSSRILELTGNLGKDSQKLAWEKAISENNESITTEKKKTVSADAKEKIELLDTLAVEQQRGITVKASTASMLYRHPSAVGPAGVLLVNMFDLPGKFGKFGMYIQQQQ